MKMKSLSFAAAALLLILPGIAACNPKEETKESAEKSAAPATESSTAPASTAPAAEAAKGSVEAQGFSIIPPAGWTKGAGKDKTIMVYLAAAENNFKPNFNVNVSEDDGTSVDKIGELIKPMFAKQFEKWKAMDEGKADVAGEPAYYLSSSFTMQGKNIQNLQYYIRGKKKRFYVLTFTALESNYKTLEPVFKQAVASVQTKE